MRKWKRSPQCDCPAFSPVREAKTGISSVFPAYLGIKMEWLWNEGPLITPVIPENGVLISFSNSCKNDKRNSNLFFNNKPCKNEKRNSFPFFKVMRSQKTKNEIRIRFSKWCENEKRNTKFKSVFQSLGEIEKQKAKFKSVFQCHTKTKNVNGIWIPFSHAIEKRLPLRYTHSGYLFYNHSQKLLNVKTCQVSHNDWFITWYLEVNRAKIISLTHKKTGMYST